MCACMWMQCLCVESYLMSNGSRQESEREMHRHVEQQHIHPPHSLIQIDYFVVLLCTHKHTSHTHCDTHSLSAHTALYACLSLCTHAYPHTSQSTLTHTYMHLSKLHTHHSLSLYLHSPLHLSVCLFGYTHSMTHRHTQMKAISTHHSLSFSVPSHSPCICLL